jgi:hypothetical protein
VERKSSRAVFPMGLDVNVIDPVAYGDAAAAPLAASPVTADD